MNTNGEWRTLGLLGGCYATWLTVTAFADVLGPWIAWPLITLTITLHSSLQHEVLHGHPFRDGMLNAALVFPALGLLIPYQRFKALHLAHHNDTNLTDPHDDPESFYLDPAAWRRLSRPLRAALRFNNTLLGRMILGPAIATAKMYRSDLRRLAHGDRSVARAWLLHALGAAPVVLWLATAGEVSAAGYALCAYLGLSILNVRTFLEHRADEAVHGRCVIVEDRGALALLFLNNNFHAVHHLRPDLPWYAIPRHYRENREHFLALNRDYRFTSYAEVLRRYALRQKEPVAHPLIANAV
jgi:fatty acid desaturase